MSDLASLSIDAVRVILSLYGAIYIITGICAPKWFLDHVAANHISRRYTAKTHSLSSISPWYEMPLIFLTLAAVGMIVYAASDAFLFAVPASWGSHDDEGEWESTRDYLKILFASLGAFGIAPRLEKNAETLVSSERDSD